MIPMTRSQVGEFLNPPRHAIVATNTINGTPQLSPVWYLYEDDRLYIGITVGSAKHRNLLRDPSISVCIDSGYPDGRYVVFYGTADLIEEGHPLQQEMTWRIIRRYHTSEEAAIQYVESTRHIERVMIVVNPDKCIARIRND